MPGTHRIAAHKRWTQWEKGCDETRPPVSRTAPRGTQFWPEDLSDAANLKATFRGPGADLPSEGVHREGAELLVATGHRRRIEGDWPVSSALLGPFLPRSSRNSARASTHGRTAYSRSGRCRNRNLYRVGLRPDGLAARQIQTVHRDFQPLPVYFDQQVMVIYLLTLKRIVGRTLNWIRVSSPSPRDKINYAAVFVALIVMHVPGKDDDAEASVRLALFEQLGQCLFGHARWGSPAPSRRRNWCKADGGTLETQNPHPREPDRVCPTTTRLPGRRPLAKSCRARPSKCWLLARSSTGYSSNLGSAESSCPAPHLDPHASHDCPKQDRQ